MLSPALLLTVATVIGRLVPMAAEIAEAVANAAADGTLTAEEAEEIGRVIGEKAGPALDVKVKGHDILHGPALGLIGAGLGRVARQVVIALRG